MASLEHLDLLLGEALECIVQAADEVRDIDIDNRKEILMRLGTATSELWGIREILYKINSSLKRDFVREFEHDKERFENLNELQINAYKAEKNGDLDYAMSIYQKLLKISRFGYFRLLAEAGLYRVSISTTLE